MVRGRVRDKKFILDLKWSEVGTKEGRNVSAHADDEPIRGPKGLVIVDAFQIHINDNDVMELYDITLDEAERKIMHIKERKC